MKEQRFLPPEVMAVKADHSDIPKRGGVGSGASSDILAVYLEGGPRYQLNHALYTFTPPCAILLNKGAIDLDLQEGKVNGIFVLFKGNGLVKEKDGSESEVFVTLGTDTLAVPVFKEISPADANKIASLLNEIDNIPGVGLISQMCKTSLLYRAIAEYCDSSNVNGKSAMHREAFRLRELIHAMALERLSMDKIYNCLNLSSAHAETLFRKAFDITPVAYRMQIRLNRARELLVTTQYNVSQIAYSVGFADPLYFSRLFRKAFGANPSSLIADSRFSRKKGEALFSLEERS